MEQTATNESEFNELDVDWATDFENKERDYNTLYQDKVTKINIYSLYVNMNCVLDKVKQDKYDLETPNCLTKSEILAILKNKKRDDGLNYKLISLLKYNIDLKPIEVKKYIYSSENFGFLDNISELQDVYFYDTITMFDNLNSIFFIYYEINKKLNNNKTKKIYITPQNSKSSRKTKRKLLKHTVPN